MAKCAGTETGIKIRKFHKLSMAIMGICAAIAASLASTTSVHAQEGWPQSEWSAQTRSSSNQAPTATGQQPYGSQGYPGESGGNQPMRQMPQMPSFGNANSDNRAANPYYSDQNAGNGGSGNNTFAAPTSV